MTTPSEIEIVPPSTEDKEKIDELAGYVLSGNWEKVVDMYRKHPVARTAGLNNAEDTALRIAISARETEIAKQLVKAASKTKGALERPNQRGVTVLHIAAYYGDSKMCRYIARKRPALIEKRNKERETPLFYAAHFGHIEAFLSLHKLLENKDHGYIHGRRGDGETILHTAISRRYYEIAYLIIQLYPKFVYAINEKGFSPLHLMASTPTAFRSGCPHIRGIHQLVYNLIHVSKLKLGADVDDKEEQHEKQQTCISSHWHRIMAFMGCSKNLQDESNDEERQHDDRTHSAEEQRSDIPKNGSQGSTRLVRVIRSSLQCLTHAISVIFGPVDEKPSDTAVTSVDKSEDTNRNKQETMKDKEAITEGKVDIIDSDQDQQLAVKEDIRKDIISFLDQIRKDIIATTEDTNRNKEEMKKKNEAEAEAKRREREALKSIAKMETPILIAARNGVIEIVKEVLCSDIKIAIHDSNIDNKNAVLLAAENRRADVYDYLLKTKHLKERMFGQTDNSGNSVLHLAAKLKEGAEPWPVSGPALQMQCEVKWYEFVKGSMGPHFFRWFNENSETPEDLFKKSHANIVKEGGEWLNKTSDSFSIVATLIATVAFATSAIVPGGVDDDNGSPNLEDKPAFSVFAISSLIALCCSIICVMMFLAILTSRYQDVDFGKDLPRKFLIGLTSLFVSVTAMLISFCAGHSFVLKDELKYAALPVYAITCLAVTVVIIAQFPFYFDLAMITFSKKPWSHKFT